MIKHEEVIKAFKELILELDLSIGEVLEVEDSNLYVIYKFITELEKKDELLELYIHAFNIFTKRNEITIKLEDRITLNEIFKNIKRLEEEMK